MRYQSIINWHRRSCKRFRISCSWWKWHWKTVCISWKTSEEWPLSRIRPFNERRELTRIMTWYCSKEGCDLTTAAHTHCSRDRLGGAGPTRWAVWAVDGGWYGPPAGIGLGKCEGSSTEWAQPGSPAGRSATGTILSSWHVLTYLTLTTTCSYLHFANEETGTERVSVLSGIAY